MISSNLPLVSLPPVANTGLCLGAVLQLSLDAGQVRLQGEGISLLLSAWPEQLPPPLAGASIALRVASLSPLRLQAQLTTPPVVHVSVACGADSRTASGATPAWQSPPLPPWQLAKADVRPAALWPTTDAVWMFGPASAMPLTGVRAQMADVGLCEAGRIWLVGMDEKGQRLRLTLALKAGILSLELAAEEKVLADYGQLPLRLAPALRRVGWRLAPPALRPLVVSPPPGWGRHGSPEAGVAAALRLLMQVLRLRPAPVG